MSGAIEGQADPVKAAFFRQQLFYKVMPFQHGYPSLSFKR